MGYFRGELHITIVLSMAFLEMKLADFAATGSMLVFMLIALNYCDSKINNIQAAHPQLSPCHQLWLGVIVALAMIFMIGRSLIIRIATSTEISVFAIVCVIVVDRLTSRELR